MYIDPFEQLAPDDPLHDDRGKTGENQAADGDYQPSESGDGDDKRPINDEMTKTKKMKPKGE